MVKCSGVNAQMVKIKCFWFSAFASTLLHCRFSNVFYNVHANNRQKFTGCDYKFFHHFRRRRHKKQQQQSFVRINEGNVLEALPPETISRNPFVYIYSSCIGKQFKASCHKRYTNWWVQHTIHTQTQTHDSVFSPSKHFIIIQQQAKFVNPIEKP